MTDSSGNLGRGLGDLFDEPAPSGPVFAPSARRYTPLFVDDIDAPDLPDQPAPELVSSIRSQGVLCPVLVRAVGDRYALIAGDDRLRAAIEAGLREVPACVVEVNDVQAMALARAAGTQHPAPNLRKLKRDWRQELAREAGCEPAELAARLRDAGRENPDQLHLDVAPPESGHDDPRPQVAEDDGLSEEDVHQRLSGSQSPGRSPWVGAAGVAAATAAILILLGWILGIFDRSPADSAGLPSIQPAPNTLPTRAPVATGPDEDPSSETQTLMEPEPMPEAEPAPFIPPAPAGPDWTWLNTLEVEGLSLQEFAGIPRVVFETGVFKFRDFITPEAESTLRTIGARLQAGPEDLLVVVTGHTDDDPVSPGGAYRDNHDIGMARAGAVSDFLIRKAGLPPHRVLATSAGEKDPPYSNATPAEKRKNRTVTLQMVIPHQAH